MNKNIKLFIHHHLFLCIFIILLLIVLPKLTIKFIHETKVTKKLANDYSFMDDCVMEIYTNNINLFEKKNDDYILKMDYLYQNDECSVSSESLYTNDLDQCVGYIKLNDSNSNITIDYSHICEMIDY